MSNYAVMVLKGTINCSTNPNYPAGDRGHTYRVSVAGKIGGASGPSVEVGDLIMATVDDTVAGTHASVGANWTIVQANIIGALLATLSEPWTSYEPTITPSSGAFDSMTLIAARYKRFGTTLHLEVSYLVTDNGEAAGHTTVTAPVASANVHSNHYHAVACTTIGLGGGIEGRAALENNGTTIYVTKYDGTHLEADNCIVLMNSTYECAP